MKVKELMELCEAQLSGKVLPVYCRTKRGFYECVAKVDVKPGKLILKSGFAPAELDKLSIQELYYKLYRLTKVNAQRNQYDVLLWTVSGWFCFKEMKKVRLPAGGWAWVLISGGQVKVLEA